MRARRTAPSCTTHRTWSRAWPPWAITRCASAGSASSTSRGRWARCCRGCSRRATGSRSSGWPPPPRSRPRWRAPRRSSPVFPRSGACSSSSMWRPCTSPTGSTVPEPPARRATPGSPTRRPSNTWTGTSAVCWRRPAAAARASRSSVPTTAPRTARTATPVTASVTRSSGPSPTPTSSSTRHDDHHHGGCRPPVPAVRLRLSAQDRVPPAAPGAGVTARPVGGRAEGRPLALLPHSVLRGALRILQPLHADRRTGRSDHRLSGRAGAPGVGGARGAGRGSPVRQRGLRRRHSDVPGGGGAGAAVRSGRARTGRRPGRRPAVGGGLTGHGDRRPAGRAGRPRHHPAEPGRTELRRRRGAHGRTPPAAGGRGGGARPDPRRRHPRAEHRPDLRHRRPDRAVVHLFPRRRPRLAARGAVPLPALRAPAHRSRPAARAGLRRRRMGRAAAAAVPPRPGPSARARLRAGLDADVSPRGCPGHRRRGLRVPDRRHGRPRLRRPLVHLPAALLLRLRRGHAPHTLDRRRVHRAHHRRFPARGLRLGDGRGRGTSPPSAPVAAPGRGDGDRRLPGPVRHRARRRLRRRAGPVPRPGVAGRERRAGAAAPVPRGPGPFGRAGPRVVLRRGARADGRLRAEVSGRTWI
ncbi:conserved hypothetical protein [Streptomyces misionensis JCM 4497]